MEVIPFLLPRTARCFLPQRHGHSAACYCESDAMPARRPGSGKHKTARVARKPNSVPGSGFPCRVTIIHLWMAVTRHLLRLTRELGRATLGRSPIWSCTGWGLPSFPGHPRNWCALTAPFHPCPAPAGAGRFAFCCTFLRVTATPCYGAPCPVVFGLSSGRISHPAIA